MFKEVLSVYFIQLKDTITINSVRLYEILTFYSANFFWKTYRYVSDVSRTLIVNII